MSLICAVAVSSRASASSSMVLLKWVLLFDKAGFVDLLPSPAKRCFSLSFFSAFFFFTIFFDDLSPGAA